MIYAILSDIHGNLEAFDAVLNHTRENVVERYVCLGDIVGYGANPKECLERIQSLNCTVCAGNHDHAATNLMDTSTFNPYAKKAVTWTQEQLSEEGMKSIRKLPYTNNDEEDFHAVHANLHDPERWGYIFDYLEASESFEHMTKPICFIGHSHVPLAFKKEEDEIQPIYNTDEITIEENCRYIINVGSVGQPRDGDKRACYCIFDSNSRKVRWQRVDYDIAKAQAKILDAGLPDFLAKRLEMGR